MRRDAALAEIVALGSELGEAADAIAAAAGDGLDDLAAARAGDTARLDEIERKLCGILEACIFGDLGAQRLATLTRALDEAGDAADGESLMNGPALPGKGLDQSAADDLMRFAR